MQTVGNQVQTVGNQVQTVGNQVQKVVNQAKTLDRKVKTAHSKVHLASLVKNVVLKWCLKYNFYNNELNPFHSVCCSVCCFHLLKNISFCNSS